MNTQIEYGAARLKDGNIHVLRFTTSSREQAVEHVDWLNGEHYEDARQMAEAQGGDAELSAWARASFALIEGSACVVLEREVTPWRVSMVQVGDEESVAVS